MGSVTKNNKNKKSNNFPHIYINKHLFEIKDNCFYLNKNKISENNNIDLSSHITHQLINNIFNNIDLSSHLTINNHKLSIDNEALVNSLVLVS